METTKIYFIRHGESQANAQNVFIGHTDLDLTEKGHKQAQKTAEFLKDVSVDKIYSSDLKRAYNTACHTSRLKGMDIEKNKNLREIFGGEWEKRTFDDLEKDYPEEYDVWLSDIGVSRCTNGESVAELQTRFVSEVEKITKENVGKTIFIFSHATPIRVLCAAWNKKNLHEIKDIPWASNASVTIAEYKNGIFSIIEYGKNDFLGDINTELPDNV